MRENAPIAKGSPWMCGEILNFRLTFGNGSLHGVNERSLCEHMMNNLMPLAPPGAPERSAEILGSIRTAFAEKGFDGASMQDLARAAGMSVGNFYRYFPSKDAIIEAMVGFDMAEMERDFAAIHTSDDPIAAIRIKIAEHVQQGCTEDGRLWAEITAAAHRKPEIARICCGMEDLVAGNLLTVFARLTGMTTEACDQRFGAHARFIVMMVKAAAMRKPAAPDPDLTALILRSIESTLSEILAARD
jgi:AcrR family transcriptional regulator